VKYPEFNILRLCLTTIALCGMAAFASAEPAAVPPAEPPASSGWSFAVTPYLWLPSVDGSLRFSAGDGEPPTPETGVDDKSLIDYLDGAFMIGGEVKKDRWLLLTDFLYVGFGNTDSEVKAVNFNPGVRGFDPINSSVNTHTQTSLNGKAWTLLGGYRVLEGAADVDLMGGLRYFGLNASTEWDLTSPVQDPSSGASLSSSGTASDSTHVWDGLFALHGRLHLGKTRWFLPFYADVGAGESRLTWQAFGGAGYAFKWLDVSLTYRTIYYDERGDGLMDQLSFTGPAASFAFRF